MREVLAIIVGVVGFIGVTVLAIGSIGERMAFPGQRARIEQLRSDAERVNVAESEDVIGQIVETNQMIRRYQTCNRLWFCDITAPDGWDDVQLIAIPQR